MRSTKEIKEQLIKHKEEIIQKYREGMLIKEIARGEDVSRRIIGKYIMKWGVWEKRKRKRIVFPGGYYKKKNINKKKNVVNIPFEKIISTELLEKMKRNTEINNKYIKHIKILNCKKNKELL